MAIYGLLAVALIYSNTTNAQEINSKIVAVYGSASAQLNSEQIAWLENCLDRSEIITLDAAAVPASDMPFLSSVPLQTKFSENTSVESFDEGTFNPLVYAINFFLKTDQYYRIDNTSYVLKVHKKED